MNGRFHTRPLEKPSLDRYVNVTEALLTEEYCCIFNWSYREARKGIKEIGQRDLANANNISLPGALSIGFVLSILRVFLFFIIFLNFVLFFSVGITHFN